MLNLGTPISQYEVVLCLLHSNKSISTVHSAITENTEIMLMKHVPQGLIIGTPISQYALYSAMFCPLHSDISKKQHEKHLCNPSSHYGKDREYVRHKTHAPYLDT